jgi:hypothetical protein
LRTSYKSHSAYAKLITKLCLPQKKLIATLFLTQITHLHIVHKLKKATNIWRTHWRKLFTKVITIFYFFMNKNIYIFGHTQYLATCNKLSSIIVKISENKAFTPFSATFENIKSAEVSIREANSTHLFITIHSWASTQSLLTCGSAT